jgi:hypothetical protein
MESEDGGVMTTDKPQIVYAAPFVALADDLRREALVLRQGKADTQADVMDAAAERLTDALRAASECEYIDTHTAAEFLRIGEEGVRARCRRMLADRGLARKRGGRWEIHTSALAA